MTIQILSLAAAAIGLMVIACGGDDDTAQPAATAAATTVAPTKAPAEATRLVQPTQPATSPATTAPSKDGTVDALNPGATDPVTVKANPSNFSGQALLKDVRIGVHPEQGGWERIVFEFNGPSLPPAKVEYVQTAAACGSGQPVSLSGTAVLQVRISQSAAHDSAGKVTVGSTDSKGPGNTILQAKQTCDFEGTVTWHLGLKGKQNFKVTTLQSPTRLVIDIKQ